jgi:L-ascorbate metabolism protein UlaG (beta-lactamase superfamily)
MKKNVLLTMLLMVATMALAACTEKKGTTMRQNTAAQTDTFKTKSGKTIIFTAIKHASIRINFDGKEIEVDPVRGLKPTTDYSCFPKADFILVTHEHFDHCDTAAIRQLEKPTTVIVTNANCAKTIGKGRVMHNGDHMKLANDITIDAVPAYNTTPGKEKYHPKGRDNGFILTLDGFRVYISGDTEDIPEMRNIKNIDVAFLSTNQPFTMTPEQTARAAKTIKPKVLFPYHYSDTDIQKVTDLLKGTGIKVLIRNYQ